MGLNLETVAQKLDLEVQNYCNSHPGKKESEALEKFYIRFKNNEIVIEKKSFWTNVKNFFSKTRRAEYDFEANFTKIAKEFLQPVKSQSQFEKLNRLAKELNTVLLHVNAKRQEKHKKPYELSQLVITYDAPAEGRGLNDTLPPSEAATMGATLDKTDVEPKPVGTAQARGLSSSTHTAAADTSRPGRLRASQMPNMEQQRAMIEGISGGRVSVPSDPAEKPSGIEEPSGVERKVRQLPRKNQGQPPISRREAFLRQHQKVAPSVSTSNAEQVSSSPAKVDDSVRIKELFKMHEGLFQRCLGDEISQVFENGDSDLAEQLAEYLDESSQEVFTDRMQALKGSWWGGYTSYDYDGTLARQVYDDITTGFDLLVDEVYALENDTQKVEKLETALNKMVNLFERAECLLEAHKENEKAQYSKALLLAEKLFSEVEKEYEGKKMLLDSLEMLMGCKKTLEPYFANKEGPMKKGDSDLYKELPVLVLLAGRCHTAGCPPKELFKEFSEIKLPNIQ